MANNPSGELLHSKTVMHSYAERSLTELMHTESDNVTRKQGEALLHNLRTQAAAMREETGVAVRHTPRIIHPSTILSYVTRSALGYNRVPTESTAHSAQQLTQAQHREAQRQGEILAEAAYQLPYAISSVGALHLNPHGVVHHANAVHREGVKWSTAVRTIFAHALFAQSAAPHLDTLATDAVESSTHTAHKAVMAHAAQHSGWPIQEENSVQITHDREKDRAAFHHDAVLALITELAVHPAPPSDTPTLRAYLHKNSPLGNPVTNTPMDTVARDVAAHVGPRKAIPALTTRTPFTVEEVAIARRDGVRAASDQWRKRVRNTFGPTRT